MNWLNTYLFPKTEHAGAVASALSAQRPAQLVQTVRALLRDITDIDSGVSASELVTDARLDDGLLQIYLHGPPGGLGHIRELSNQIRDLLADLPEVRRVTVEVVLTLH